MDPTPPSEITITSSDAPSAPSEIDLEGGSPSAPSAPDPITADQPASLTAPNAITQTGDTDPDSPSLVTREVEVGSVSFSTDTITTTEPHGLVQNQSFQFAADNMPGGLLADTTYYADVISATEIRPLDAPDGNVIDITSGGSGNRRLIVNALEKATDLSGPSPITQSAPDAPAAPATISQSSGDAPAAPEPIAVDEPGQYSTVPVEIVQSGSTDPSPPTAIVITGEQPPTSQQVAPYSDATQLTHTDPVPGDQHSFVNVGARAAPVDIELPAEPDIGINVWAADQSFQAAEYKIRIVPTGGLAIEGGEPLEIIYNGAVGHVRWDGTIWKVI